ncbi:MAG TPA: DUF86 domain-containing protein [Candidatus Methanomethylicus sp.]|jgi:uncharacterized protein with HEPN domain|nr:DUF86 domain-containing protein [Candidatus Methanomethylicus sp.]HRR54706.1 DUF86 domain-containing protein [Candidatus Methanomethylicus sp.]
MKRDIVLLLEINESVKLIMEYSKGKSINDYHNSRSLQDSILYRFVIIGEATKNLSKSIFTAYPSIPWSKMAKMRDYVAHKYSHVDDELIWKTIVDDMPPLKHAIDEILGELSSR